MQNFCMAEVLHRLKQAVNHSWNGIDTSRFHNSVVHCFYKPGHILFTSTSTKLNMQMAPKVG